MSYVTDKFDNKVAGLLISGGVGLLPTDTIYGLSVRALDEKAVEKLDKIKSRSPNKPYVILISDIKQLALFNLTMPGRLKHYWPGAFTIIFEAPNSPSWLHRGTETLAIRLPAHEQLRKLINTTGPLISTSANRADKSPAVSVEEVKTIFDCELDYYVDVGKLNGLPSTIVKLSGDKLEVIRAGTVKINK